MTAHAKITFTLDGRVLETESSHDLTAADILRLGGLDPAGYDLTEVRPGHAEPKKYEDDQHVPVKNGDVFFSVRQSAPVA